MMTALHPHFDGKRFFNPSGMNAQSLSAARRMIAEQRAQWPASVPVVPQQPPAIEPRAWATLTFVGHSTFLIQSRDGNILTDPMFSERASPFTFIGPRRVRVPGVRLADLPEISVVLLSHNHYDHCDLPTLAAVQRRFEPLLVAPLANRRVAQTAGMRRIEELDWWERSTASRIPIVATPAQHFSARTPFDRNRALWGGFLVEIEGRRIFFAGDSGYAPHFREVRERFGAIDVALLPIGAYEPRWFMQNVHMNPEEAVQAHIDLAARLSVGMHFGTFQLTAEGIDAPLEALDLARRQRGVAADQFSTLAFGASIQLLS